jgi:hypothetical protein
MIHILAGFPLTGIRVVYLKTLACTSRENILGERRIISLCPGWMEKDSVTKEAIIFGVFG